MESLIQICSLFCVLVLPLVWVISFFKLFSTVLHSPPFRRGPFVGTGTNTVSSPFSSPSLFPPSVIAHKGVTYSLTASFLQSPISVFFMYWAYFAQSPRRTRIQILENIKGTLGCVGVWHHHLDRLGHKSYITWISALYYSSLGCRVNSWSNLVFSFFYQGGIQNGIFGLMCEDLVKGNRKRHECNLRVAYKGPLWLLQLYGNCKDPRVPYSCIDLVSFCVQAHTDGDIKC